MLSPARAGVRRDAFRQQDFQRKGFMTTGSSGSDSSSLTRDQRLWRWRVLIATYLAYAGYYLTRKVFTICKTTLASEFDIGLDQVAHIWTAYLVAYMVGQFLNSFLGRKYGPRAILLAGFGGTILINLHFGFADSYWTFMEFMIFNGLLQATGWPGVVGGVAQWLRPRERGSIMGVWSTSYLVGNIMVKSAGGFLLANMGWRFAFFGTSLIAFVIWWLVYAWQRDKPEDAGLDPILDEASAESRAVQASNAEQVTFREYLRLLLNPVVPLMGLSYFFIKFLRYALDSWLPTFLDLQGMDVGSAAYYSQLFDFAGLAGAIMAGWALDRLFRGNWAALCFFLGLGMVGGYYVVTQFGGNPYALAISFGLVGFMMYGPDTILCGAASVAVAGERNGVALAGIVNGIASIGPVVQEEVIGWFLRLDESLPAHVAHAASEASAMIHAGPFARGVQAAVSEFVTTCQQQAAIDRTNQLGLILSVAFVALMALLIWRVAAAHKKHAQ